MRICFIPGLLQGLDEYRDGLCARDRVFLGKDEERHPGDAQLRGSCFIVTHRRAVVIALQYRQRCILGDVELRGEAGQGGAAADRQAFAKISVHDAFARFLAPRLSGGEMQQAMGVKGIAGLRLLQAIG